MTMFLGVPTLTTVAPLVSSDKGSIGNRINCAGAQYLNALGTTAGVVGTVAGTEYLVNNSDKIKTFAEKIDATLAKTKLPAFVKTGVNKIADYASKAFNNLRTSKIGQHISQGIQKIKPFLDKTIKAISKFSNTTMNLINKLPKGGKIALVATLATIVLNGIYKSGQIDQKYTDRAKMEKNMV